MSLKITIPVAATLTLQVTKSAGLSFISESPALVEPQTRGVAVLTVAMYSWTSSDPIPPHQHEIDEVDGLSDLLTSLGGSITALQTALADLAIEDVSGLNEALTALGEQIAAISTEWDDISGKPTEFPPSAHEHMISEVMGLRDELDALAEAIGGISGETNLGVTLSATDVTITSDTGDDAAIPAADTENAGVMLPSHVAQLAGLDAALASARCWAASHG